MALENIHKARIFDIGAGLGTSLDSTLTIVNARSTVLLAKAKDSFRSFIDDATPSVYTINIGNDVVEPIFSNFSISTTKEVFTAELTKEMYSIGFPMTTEYLQEVIRLATDKAEARLAATVQSDSASHLDYRNIFYYLGKEIAQLFNSLDSKKNSIIISNPEAMGLPGKLVLIGKSFSSTQNSVNVIINKVLRKYTDNTKASFGSIVHAGHTAVVIDETVAGGKTYATNTPLTQEILFKVEASASSKLLDPKVFQDDFVKKVPLFLNTAITFSENFTPTAKNLLSIGFSFVVPMDATLNSLSGQVERAAAKELVKTIILPEIATAMKDRLSWLKVNATGIRGSPTIPEFIKALVISIIKGEKIQTSVYSETKKTSKKLVIAIPTSVNLSINKKVKDSKVSSTLRRIKTGHFTSLASIQAIMDQTITEQVKNNMGAGDRKDILNYQTGRFAESVKIERLSQSREGMISVFYSYMRNPYGTFSIGGQQSIPQTRDPKTLISKSIREIGAKLVSNRMRGILV